MPLPEMLVSFLDLYARMAAQSGLHSCVKPEPTQNNPSMWNWTGSRSPPNAAAADDDAWEARAISEDAAGGSALMGTTWPPRSYSCTFCRREFKSAQALGGHMNVHRRDRAKLRSVQGTDPASSSPTSAAQPIVFPPLPRAPPPEFVANGGILLIYPIGAGAGAVFAPAVASPPSFGSSLPQGEVGRSSSSSPPATKEEGNDGVVVEELDLELRLGR